MVGWVRLDTLSSNFPPVHGLSPSQIFPTPANEGDDPNDLRDMEGPTVRELMDMERAARISC